MSSIVSTKFRRGTNFKVTFPTLPSLTFQPSRVDLYQKRNNHDILVMEFYAVSPLWFKTITTGAPIQFSWTQDTLTRYWVGYVSSISKVDAAQRTNLMTITCVSATFLMKQRSTRVFTDVRVTDVVEQLATEFGFNYVGGVPSEPVFPQLAIAGSSYWEWIQEQAKRIGYGVVVDGMNFVFKPLDKIIDLWFSDAPVLSIGNTGAAFNTQYLDRTLDYFKVLSGDNIEDSNDFRTVKNVGGVDPLTAKYYTENASPANSGASLRTSVADVLFSEYRSDRVAHSSVAAQALATGSAELARFNIPAKVKCQGDPRIRPFGTVFISGTGELTDGFWMVREAQHMFHKIGDYQMDLTIATDGLGDTQESAFRSRGANLVGTVNLNAALENGGTQVNSFGLKNAVLVTKDPTTIEGANTSQWKAA